MSKCGKECEIYSRCVGYHRPVKNWNKGKQAEFLDRKPFNPLAYLTKTKNQETQR